MNREYNNMENDAIITIHMDKKCPNVWWNRLPKR